MRLIAKKSNSQLSEYFSRAILLLYHTICHIALTGSRVHTAYVNIYDHFKIARISNVIVGVPRFLLRIGVARVLASTVFADPALFGIITV